jgi:protein disulfide-isomerase-like protein
MSRLLAGLLFVAFVVSASDVLILDPDNFDSEVGGSSPVFIEFFAPWCGHCKNLAPEYEILATAFKGQAVKIASVDADKHKSLASRFSVTGFPTLKYFPADTTKPEDYNGGRTAPDLADWINKRAGTNAKIKGPVTAVTVLTPDNFDDIVKDETKSVLVEFYAPWCGHCKSLAPKYEEVAKSFDGEEDVVIAKLDADAHKEPASQYGVTGYPTLKWFPKNNKQGEDYNGGREVHDFIKFINEKTGTQRVAGGGYNENYGRVEALDSLARRFMSASAADRAAILEETHDVIANLDAKEQQSAKFYESTMKRILEKNDAGFGKSEAARLKRVVDSGSVAKGKRAEFARRINIVNQF